MTLALRSSTRPRSTVALLQTIGSRLTQAERAPYELPVHDAELSFDEPTGDIVLRAIARDNTPTEKKHP